VGNFAASPLDQLAFLMISAGAMIFSVCSRNSSPAQQILAVAADLRLLPLRAGGANDQAHPFGDVEVRPESPSRRAPTSGRWPEVIFRDIPPPAAAKFGITA